MLSEFPASLDCTPVDQMPSDIAAVHAKARRHCELCQVKNFSIGGRTKDGAFFPLFQPHEDAAAARAAIGKLAWCGHGAPTHLLRVLRVICQVVRIGEEPSSTLLLCERCIGAMREHTVVEVAA